MLQSRTVLRVSVCAAVLAAAATSAVAVQNGWQGPDFGDWYQPPNWTLNHVPLATEDVIIDNETTAQVDVPGQSAEASQLTLAALGVGGLRHLAGEVTVGSSLRLGYGHSGHGTYQLSGAPDVELAPVVGVLLVGHVDVDVAKGLVGAGAVFIADPERVLVELHVLRARVPEDGAAESTVADRIDGPLPGHRLAPHVARDFVFKD